MSEDLDTNINNYTNEELLEIVGFDGINIPTTDQINSRLNKIINKYKLENNNTYVSFFIQAKKQILNNESEKQILNNESLNNRSTSQEDTLIFRDNPNIQPTYPVDINVGILNPNKQQLFKKYITINSKCRQDIVPYSCNPNSKTSSTKFICTLSEKIKNTVRLKINSMCIPKTWYTFDDFNGNTYFQIDGSGGPYNIHITEGNYTPENLKIEIQDKINDIPLDISVNLVKNISTPKIKFTNNNNTLPYTINFYKYDNSLTYNISCDNTTTTIVIDKYDNNLGYNLGFRNTNISDPDLKITLDASGGSIIADAPIDLTGTQYVVLVIDDYNYNHINNGITIDVKDNKVGLPEYSGKILQDISCIDDISNQNIYLPTFPRKLTQSQIYSINEINSQQNKQSNRTVSYNNSNIIAITHFPSEILNDNNMIQKYNINLSDQLLNERIYFGPVCIEKLHISLYNDNGNILNLHGQDWSITMIAEELYNI